MCTCRAKNVRVKGKNIHADSGWPTKQFLHVLLGIGHSGAGHHKARVRIVAALTQPAKPPQDKGSVASKHSPARQPTHTIYQQVTQRLRACNPRLWCTGGCVQQPCGKSGRCCLKVQTAGKQAETQTHCNTGRQTGRQADRQAGRQACRQRYQLCDLLVCMAFIHHNILEVGQNA